MPDFNELKRSAWNQLSATSRGSVLARLRDYARLMRFHRPIGIFLLLWPTLWALWVAAEGPPPFKLLVIFVVGVVLMRAAGCVINDFADREFDPQVKRTRDRPIAAGRVSPLEALILFLVLISLAFILVLMLNTLSILIALAAAALAAVYPFTKRLFYFPQVVLGAAFACAIPMAFAAHTGSVPDLAWLMFITAVLWTVAYDTQYAMVDIRDDVRIGVKSTAILFGDLDRHIIAVIQAMVLLGLLLVGDALGRGLFFHLGLAAAAALAGYQQYLIFDRDEDRCFKAFSNNNWLGLAVFVGLVLDYWYLVPVYAPASGQ